MNQATGAQRTKRVLVVAYVFPPSGGAGVQRVTKFVRYLPEFGWDCSVLTVANPSVPVFDESLAAEIPDSVVVRKARTKEPGYALKKAVSAGDGTSAGKAIPSRFKQFAKNAIRAVGNTVLQPDAQLLWYPQAVREGKRLLNELRHDAIFVTAPPFSSFLVGRALAESSGLPLVCDYRDEWGISNRYQENRQKSSLSNRLQQQMQRNVLRRANAVLATTGRSADSLREVVEASGSQASVSHIYNGYDQNDVAALTSITTPDESRLRISYVGTLWNLTDIEPVVAALLQLSTTAPKLAARVDLHLAGRRTADQDQVVDRLEGTPVTVIREGYVDHGRAIDIMGQSNMLCLLLSGVPEASRVVPAKTFEYMAMQRPILAVVPNGEVSEILTGNPLAHVFEPSSVEDIAAFFQQRLETGPTESITQTSFDATRFERRALAAQLGEILNEVAGFAPSPDSSNDLRAQLAATVTTPAQEALQS